MASVRQVGKLGARVYLFNRTAVRVCRNNDEQYMQYRFFSSGNSNAAMAFPAYYPNSDSFFKGNSVNTVHSSGICQPGITRPVLSPYCTSVKEQTCWKCGTEIDPEESQYFCECGIVQPPLENRNFFEVLGVEVGFVQNTALLAKRHIDLQRLLHPDKFSQRSEEEKVISLTQSSRVNKAYSTLAKPLPRAIYLLQLHGLSIEEDEIELNPEFLMEIMEMNEDLIECETDVCVRRVKDQNDSVTQGLLDDLTKAFGNEQYEEAKVIVSKLQYYHNIEEKVKDKEQMML